MIFSSVRLQETVENMKKYAKNIKEIRGNMSQGPYIGREFRIFQSPNDSGNHLRTPLNSI